MQMELISRKEFDSRVTSGELDNLQAIKVKGKRRLSTVWSRIQDPVT
ncbi:TPA: hypothetical protein JLV69_004086 [Escherichia coli]|nr:hypothetical protein [Escherichia coli]